MPRRSKYALIKLTSTQVRWVNINYFTCHGRGSFLGLSCLWDECMQTLWSLSCICHFNTPLRMSSNKSSFASTLSICNFILISFGQKGALFSTSKELRVNINTPSVLQQQYNPDVDENLNSTWRTNFKEAVIKNMFFLCKV